MNTSWDVIIVGGGMAGVTAFATIRERSPNTTVLLINGEGRLPYKRTKLSKFLSRGFEKDQFALHDQSFFTGTTDALLQSECAESIDPDRKRLTLSDGTQLSYGKLVLTPGATPVVDPTWDSGVLTLRTARDAEVLRERALECKRAIVLGTGILGVETADQLTDMGLSVSLFGRAECPMNKQLDNGSASILLAGLERAGVEISNNAVAADVTAGPDGSLVVSGDGWTDRADMVVACLGTTPSYSLARKAGIAVNAGILVDRHMQTSEPHIAAAGDAIELPDSTVPHLWHQAEATGEVAGYTAIGESVPFANEAFRTKCEVFGHYFFSCGVVHPGNDHEAVQIDRGDEVYLSCVFSGERLVGINMVDDSDNAKTYEKAVRESWGRDQVEACFLKI